MQTCLAELVWFIVSEVILSIFDSFDNLHTFSMFSCKFDLASWYSSISVISLLQVSFDVAAEPVENERHAEKGTNHYSTTVLILRWDMGT